MKDRKDDFVVSDAITDLEQAFPLKDLLALDFFSRHRDGYYRCREEGWQARFIDNPFFRTGAAVEKATPQT